MKVISSLIGAGSFVEARRDHVPNAALVRVRLDLVVDGFSSVSYMHTMNMDNSS